MENSSIWITKPSGNSSKYFFLSVFVSFHLKKAWLEMPCNIKWVDIDCSFLLFLTGANHTDWALRPAVSSAFFSPMTGNNVVTVSFDDRIKIFNTSNESLSKHYNKSIQPCQIIDHLTKTDKKTTAIKVSIYTYLQ